MQWNRLQIFWIGCCRENKKEVEKERLAAVENLKASSSVGKVKLTWSEVKDAEG